MYGSLVLCSYVFYIDQVEVSFFKILLSENDFEKSPKELLKWILKIKPSGTRSFKIKMKIYVSSHCWCGASAIYWSGNGVLRVNLI